MRGIKDGRRRSSGIVAGFLLLILAAGPVRANPGPDLVALAESSWGAPIEGFAERAGLRPGEYSQGTLPPPRPQYIQVISPLRKMTAGRWEPTELFPSTFGFTKPAGLREISGALSDTVRQPQAVMAATRLYGPPTRSTEALDMTTHIWVFKRTVLEISPFTFRLYPKQAGQ
jgi:hypothetical protein